MITSLSLDRRFTIPPSPIHPHSHLYPSSLHPSITLHSALVGATHLSITSSSLWDRLILTPSALHHQVDNFLAGATKPMHVPVAVENRAVKFWFVMNRFAPTSFELLIFLNVASLTFLLQVYT